MSKPIAEIRIDYVCDLNLQHIDVFHTGDGDEEGHTVAVVCLDTGKVIFHENDYRLDPQVKGAIKEIKSGKTFGSYNY
jgi:hypothetical protein